ncbi:metastasis-associated protein MTA3-like isoform X2 [Anneissia japonica]|uniref:metastasis-associated protein MTA3-like isoform X2 n=1 Tax=Anneissia japonica TaxID=1529436 RepID=UPI0014259817|nr:metastasis-associated protein MTA3-like isoform X2 [Anneissia japonica]
MAANMYRVGDYVYFETSSSQPYLIRRIEELNKTANGNVEAKVVCFYRRRDIPSSLIQLADKHAMAIEEEMEEALEELAEKDRHQLKHRELFLSRQLETLPATHIRGKCTVTLLNETESLLSYLNKDDAYFYSLVYDPQQKTLLADKGEIRVGSRYQADITPKLKEGESDNRDLSKLESRIWNNDNGLTEKQIDQFLVVARSVGTFARALDCSSSVRQPSLHMSAAAASRDITLFHAMDALHKNNYDIAKAVSTLVPSAGPVLCRDQMEEWSASEANMFEEALEKYGKDFNDIRQDFLPWKSLKSVIEYYYMWKTTDRYVQQKRLKAAEAESKLKQVYIPNYNKPNPNQILNKPGLPHDAQGQLPPGARACESCYTQSSYQWYSWGPANMQCRLCASCWTYWKKCGGLKMPTRLDGERPAMLRPRQDGLERVAGGMHRVFHCTIAGCGQEFKLKSHLARHCQTVHGLTIRTSAIRASGVKTRQAFFLSTTPLTKLSRRICRKILNIHHAARNPFNPVNSSGIKAECQSIPTEELKKYMHYKIRVRPKLEMVVSKIGVEMLAQKSQTTTRPMYNPIEPPKMSFPPPLTSHQSPRKTNYTTYTTESRSVARTVLQPVKRAYPDAQNGVAGPPTKRPYIGGSVGRESGRKADMGSEAKKKKLSWLDAPDDVFFHANETTKRLRQQVSNATQKRAARRPYKLMKIAAKYQPPRIVSSASTPANPAGSGQVKLASSAGSKPLASAPSSKLLPSTPANPLPITGVNKMPMTGVTKLAPMVATAPDGNVKSGEPIVID